MSTLYTFPFGDDDDTLKLVKCDEINL